MMSAEPTPTDTQVEHSLELVLGQPIEFTWTLTRRRRNSPRVGSWDWEKVWLTQGWPGQQEPSPRRGIVAGIRILADGRVLWNGGDATPTWTPTRSFSAYLVAWHLRRRPVLVLPQHCRAVS